MDTLYLRTTAQVLERERTLVVVLVRDRVLFDERRTWVLITERDMWWRCSCRPLDRKSCGVFCWDLGFELHGGGREEDEWASSKRPVTRAL